MISTNQRLLLAVALLLALAGCSSSPSKEEGFDLPESVTVELTGEKTEEAAPAESKNPEETTAEAPSEGEAKPKVSDEDSAAVLARMKARSTPTTVVTRDPEQEKQAQKAKADYNAALVEMKKGNLDGALARFKQLANEYPALGGPIVNQAIILRKKGQLDAAHKVLQDALLTHGRNPYLLNELGVTSRELGQFKKAQVSYESAIRVDPNYAKAHYNLAGLADLYLHDPNLALQEFQQYQTLVAEPDKQVDGWIKELERRIAKQKS